MKKKKIGKQREETGVDRNVIKLGRKIRSRRRRIRWKCLEK